MHNANTRDPQIISFQTIRKTIGWLGISLPAVMIAGTLAIGNCTSVQDSISHYYFTVMGSVLVGILCAVGLFLLAYMGYEAIDQWSTNTAGFFAIVVALFPTNNNSADSCAIIPVSFGQLSTYIHYTSALLFFITLAYICIGLFTRSKGQVTPQKLQRNKLYRICGTIILVCMALIGLYWQWMRSPAIDVYKPVFWLESIALCAFGLSWLVKGEFIMEDQ